MKGEELVIHTEFLFQAGSIWVTKSNFAGAEVVGMTSMLSGRKSAETNMLNHRLIILDPACTEKGAENICARASKANVTVKSLGWLIGVSFLEELQFSIWNSSWLCRQNQITNLIFFLDHLNLLWAPSQRCKAVQDIGGFLYTIVTVGWC